MRPAPASAVPPHAAVLLFARFLGGALPATRLCGVTDLLDESDASGDERLAFARFFLDATSDDLVRLPDSDELADLLAIARA